MRFTSVSFAAALLAAPLLAQSVPSGSPTPQPAVLRLHASLSSAAVLGQSSFTVEEDGRGVPIRAFAAPGAGPEAELDIIFDAVNQPFTRLEYAQEQVTKFLKENGGHLAQPLSIYVMSDTGTHSLAPAGANGDALAQSMSSGFATLRDIRRSAGLYGAVDRLDISLKALNGLAEDAAKRPGHKIFLFISPGWPLLDVPDSVYHEGQKSIFASAVHLDNLLQAADATVYMIAPDNGVNDVTFHRFVYKSYEKPLTKVGQSAYADLALQVFAVHSGGLVFDSSNDVAGELAQSIADANASYTLVVNADTSNGDHTTYHALKVATPAGKARTTSGYYELGRQM